MEEGAIRIAKPKNDFSNICSDGFHFPSNLKKIPNDIEKLVHDYVHDAYGQYREWVKTAERVSAVSFERTKAIEKLEAIFLTRTI